MARIWYTKNYCVQFCKSKTCFGPVNPRPMKPSPSLMAMVATIYQRATRSWCGASPTCWTTSSLMCGPYLKLSTYPPQVPNRKMGVRSILPQPPPLPTLGGVGVAEGSVHVVNYVERIPLRLTNHPIRHLAPWSIVYDSQASPTLFWVDAHILTKPTISTSIICLPIMSHGHGFNLYIDGSSQNSPPPLPTPPKVAHPLPLHFIQ